MESEKEVLKGIFKSYMLSATNKDMPFKTEVVTFVNMASSVTHLHNVITL